MTAECNCVKFCGVAVLELDFVTITFLITIESAVMTLFYTILK